MPRKRKIPSYRLHKSSGQAVVTIRKKDYYLGIYGTPESRKEYDRLIAEFLSTDGIVTTHGHGIGIGLSCDELILRYVRFAENYYVKNGKQTQQVERVKRSLGVVSSIYGDADAGRFGPLALKAVREQMIRRGWVRVHINSCVDTIKRAWKWAASEELIPVSCYEALRTVDGLRRGRSKAKESKPVKPVSVEIVEATLPGLLPPLQAAVRLQLLTGARSGEILILRPCDVDRRNDIWKYRPESHKTEHYTREKIILLGPKAQRYLLPYLEREPEEYCFSPSEGVSLWKKEKRCKRKSKVQPSQLDRSKEDPQRAPGQKYDSRAYNRAITRACEKLKIPKWRPHQLRHTAATLLVEEFGWDVARTILGHRSLDATRIYGEDSLQKAEDAMLKVG